MSKNDPELDDVVLLLVNSVPKTQWRDNTAENGEEETKLYLNDSYTNQKRTQRSTSVLFRN